MNLRNLRFRKADAYTEKKIVNEEFVDEDTGDVINVDREVIELTPEGEAQLARLYQEKTKPLEHDLSTLYDKLYGFQQQSLNSYLEGKEISTAIRDLTIRKEESFIDLEEESGKASDVDKDAIANRYANEIESIEEEIAQKKTEYYITQQKGRALDDSVNLVNDEIEKVEEELKTAKEEVRQEIWEQENN